MDREPNRFELNSEQHLRPILAQILSDNLIKNTDEKKVSDDKDLCNGISISGDHHEVLLKVFLNVYLTNSCYRILAN